MNMLEHSLMKSKHQFLTKVRNVCPKILKPGGYQRVIVKSQWIIAGGCCFWSEVVTFLGLLVTTFTGVVALSGAETF